MRSLFTVVALGCILLAVGYGLFLYVYGSKQSSSHTVVDPTDYRNSTYTIEGQTIQLQNGSAETEIVAGTTVKQHTEYFGNEVRKDLNGDGQEDVAFLLTQQSGGSGVFYYLVAALKSDVGYTGSRGIFIGDRIVPEKTESGSGTTVIVTYADRAVEESFADTPSQSKGVTFTFDTAASAFIEVRAHSSGSVATATTLIGKTWQWDSTTDATGAPVALKNPAAFSISFMTDGTFAATTDCNGVGGNYTADADTLALRNITATEMYCEGAEESQFTSWLTRTVSYHINDAGKLILDLADQSGVVQFR